MWHASAAPRSIYVDAIFCEQAARWALEGVGDASLGEWAERTPRAVHVRRRLTLAEQLSVGDAKDLRGTREALDRYRAAARRLPAAGLKYAREELGL